MSIVDVVERARREPPYVPPYAESSEDIFVCSVVEPIPWDRCAIEKTLGFELPHEIVELWGACGGMRLYCDSLWCPGGLVVCSPTDGDLFKQNNMYRSSWSNSVLPGDLIFAKFLEDLEHPLIRCDKNAADYGSIIIVAEMDPRPDWKAAGRSLEEFLLKYMDARGEKYWTYHYQKKLAERAAQQNPEGK